MRAFQDYYPDQVSHCYGCGRLIIVDYKKEKGVSPDWIFGHVRADKKAVIEEVAKAGFVFVDEVEMMKLQYVIRFEKKQDGARREIQ